MKHGNVVRSASCGGRSSRGVSGEMAGSLITARRKPQELFEQVRESVEMAAGTPEVQERYCQLTGMEGMNWRTK